MSDRLCSPGTAGFSRHCPPPLQENLRQFVDRVFSVITKSGVSCPTVMCDIFFSLREAAATRFQGECPWAPCGEASRLQGTRSSHQGQGSSCCCWEGSATSVEGSLSAPPLSTLHCLPPPLGEPGPAWGIAARSRALSQWLQFSSRARFLPVAQEARRSLSVCLHHR